MIKISRPFWQPFWRPFFFYCVLSACLAAPAAAAISWNVTFEDTTEEFAEFYDDIVSHTIAAGNDWASYMDPSLTASLEVIVRFDPNLSTASGASVKSDFVENNGTYNIFQWGATAEILSGMDPNGSAPDIRITLGTDYLRDDFWFYPDPSNRIENVPSSKVEAYKTLAHELGHALAFNGWQDAFDGSLPGDYASPFDVLTSFDGTNLYFNGTAATDIYGGPVPLTYGNSRHVGNRSPRPGDDLLNDLMNGVVTKRGRKYAISALDLAIAQDVGVPIVLIPSPGDFDGDFDVDGSDFLVWQRGGSPTALSQSDLDDWESNFEATPLLTANSSPVPEPATSLLLVLGMLGTALVPTRCLGKVPKRQTLAISKPFLP